MKSAILSQPCLDNSLSSVDQRHAITEWHGLVHCLRHIGIPVFLMPTVSYLDKHFALSFHGFIYNEYCLLSHRQQDNAAYAPYLNAWLSESNDFPYTIKTSYPRAHQDHREPLFFSGQADCTLIDDTLYMGYGSLTDIEVSNDLVSLMRTKTVELCLSQPNTTLMDCLLPINTGQMLIHQTPLSPEATSTLADSFSLLCIQDDPELLPCHSAMHDMHAICNQNCTETIKILTELGYQVHPLPMDFYQSIQLGPRSLMLPVW